MKQNFAAQGFHTARNGKLTACLSMIRLTMSPATVTQHQHSIADEFPRLGKPKTRNLDALL